MYILKEIMILFVPGVAGVLLYRYLEKTQWSVWSYIENYSLFTFIIYFLVRTTFYLSGLQEFSVQTADLSVQIKCGILGLIYAAVLAVVFRYWRTVWKQLTEISLGEWKK